MQGWIRVHLAFVFQPQNPATAGPYSLETGSIAALAAAVVRILVAVAVAVHISHLVRNLQQLKHPEGPRTRIVFYFGP